MYKYILNGRFLTRAITGVERYAYELIRELDKLMNKGECLLAVPTGKHQAINLNNIVIKEIGNTHGNLWEQTELPLFIMQNKAIGIHLCNVAPIIKPDIVCVHDMNIRANKKNFSKKFWCWYRIQFFFSMKYAKRIITVSSFSKSEIKKYYPHAAKKIVVITSGWQHIKRVEVEEKIFERYPELENKSYFLALSSRSRHKNFEWIEKCAIANPQYNFVIVGKTESKIFESVSQCIAKNIIYTGYLSDGEIKALMKKCGAFLFPTLYEGFGLPPLEAISQGAEAICSDIPVLHEIYENSVTYINPFEILDIMNFPKENPYKKRILDKYSWEKSALDLYEILETYLHS